jgi:hypothetical protein
MSNRTKTFAQYLTAYQRFTGTETMDATNTAVATLAFTRNMRRGWESWQWPWADVTEERTLDVNNRIEYDQTGENRIAEVFAVYNTDPQSSTGAYTISYTLDQDGILFGGANIPTTAYVYYRKDCPDYYGDAYNAGTTYAIGDQVYYATTGDFYVAIASTTGNAPTDATKWTRLTVPWDLFEYAVLRGAADLLTSNGQNPPTGRASTLYGQAEDEIYNQIEKYGRQQSFRPNKQTFFTHGTQQLRN